MSHDRASRPDTPTMFPLLILTDRHQAGRELCDVVRAALDGGARAIILREKDLPRAERVELAARLHEPVRAAGGLLIGADDDLEHCDGIHLSAQAPEPIIDHPPALVGRSCHDRAEVEAATVHGAAYATLSPIFASPSKPGYGPALGTPALRELAGGNLPLFALGGIDGPRRAARCIEAGAAGVAVMGAVMRAADPQRVVERLVAAVCEAPA